MAIKPIKILFSIPNFDTAGSGKVLYDLAKGLDKDCFEVEIACTRKDGEFFREVAALGLPIHITPTTVPLRPYITLFNRMKPIRNFIKEGKYDIVHSWHWSSDWTEVVATKMSRAKFVYTKKAMSWGNRHWKIKSRLADFIITINSDMQKYFPNKKAQKLIPLGLDTDYYSPVTFNTNRDSSDIFEIVTVANLVPVKGVEVLIDAVASLNNEAVHLRIVGDASNEYGISLKQKVNDLQTRSAITFVGKQLDVRPYLAESDLYVIPTLNEGRKEGMPMALVEAMSMGVPVLGSDISGINYVLRDFQNLLFHTGNADELGSKLKEIMRMDQNERKNLGETLRAYCVSNYGMKQFISAHEELYKSIVS